MALINKAQRQQLIANGRARQEATRDGRDFDPVPVVYLMAEQEWPRWLLTDIDPQDPDRAYGICDLGNVPEFGFVSRRALEGLRGLIGLDIRQAGGFVAYRPVSEYLDQLRIRGYLIP